MKLSQECEACYFRKVYGNNTEVWAGKCKNCPYEKKKNRTVGKKSK